MAARSIWKGHIKVQLLTIAVKVYNGVETSESGVKFNQVHAGENHFGAVGYDKKCKKCNKVVAGDEIKKGYMIGEDQYVIIEDQDIDKIKVKSSKIAEIMKFVDRDSIPAAYFERPYIAAPDGVIGGSPYALLRDTLAKSGKVGLAKMVFKDREDIVAIAPFGDTIAMYVLRYPAEVRDQTDLKQEDLDLAKSPEKGHEHHAMFKEQLKLTSMLVDNMSGDFNDVMKDKDFGVDKYTTALKALVDARIQKKEYVFSEEQEVVVPNAMEALTASIAATKKAGAEKPVKVKKKAAAGAR